MRPTRDKLTQVTKGHTGFPSGRTARKSPLTTSRPAGANETSSARCGRPRGTASQACRFYARSRDGGVSGANSRRALSSQHGYSSSSPADNPAPAHGLRLIFVEHASASTRSAPSPELRGGVSPSRNVPPQATAYDAYAGTSAHRRSRYGRPPWEAGARAAGPRRGARSRFVLLALGVSSSALVATWPAVRLSTAATSRPAQGYGEEAEPATPPPARLGLLA